MGLKCSKDRRFEFHDTYILLKVQLFSSSVITVFVALLRPTLLLKNNLRLVIDNNFTGKFKLFIVIFLSPVFAVKYPRTIAVSEHLFDIRHVFIY